MNHSATTLKKVGDASCGMAMLDVVDGQNRVTRQASFEECHSQGLRHRGADIFIFKDRSMTELLIQKRNPHLKAEPGKFISSASGHVEAGETYEEGALREMREELFHKKELSDITLVPISTYPMTDRPTNHELVRLFYAFYPGPFFPDPEEVTRLDFVNLDKLRRDMGAHPEKYCVCFIRSMEEFDRFIK